MLINVSHRINEIDKEVAAILVATQKLSSTPISRSKAAQRTSTKDISKSSTLKDTSKQHQLRISQWYKDYIETINAILVFLAISFFSILLISMKT